MADALHDEAVANVHIAAQEGMDALAAGGDCEAAVVAAVRHLERTPCYNAGRGSCMNAEGEFEADAGIMRSSDGRKGGVGAVPELADAIVVAREVMRASRHALLVGEGAARFARSRGVGTFDRDAIWTQKSQDRYEAALANRAARDNRADTVGAVALDSGGRVCAGASTGGVLLKHPGRVGDTPLPGVGYFAHRVLGAATATGVGEAIMGRAFCWQLLYRYSRGEASLQVLAETMCDELRRDTGCAVGVIAVTPDGEHAAAHASKHMSWAQALDGTETEGGLVCPRTRVDDSEQE
jgi:beta-aspartyl-peptidase (threonine type)